jgi:hypothetical protein
LIRGSIEKLCNRLRIIGLHDAVPLDSEQSVRSFREFQKGGFMKSSIIGILLLVSTVFAGEQVASGRPAAEPTPRLKRLLDWLSRNQKP